MAVRVWWVGRFRFPLLQSVGAADFLSLFCSMISQPPPFCSDFAMQRGFERKKNNVTLMLMLSGQRHRHSPLRRPLCNARPQFGLRCSSFLESLWEREIVHHVWINRRNFNWHLVEPPSLRGEFYLVCIFWAPLVNERNAFFSHVIDAAVKEFMFIFRLPELAAELT